MGIFDIDGEREPLHGGVRNLGAVHFLVEEVAPAADRLREREAGDHAIRHAEKIDFMDEAEQENAQSAADDAADDGQAAVAKT